MTMPAENILAASDSGLINLIVIVVLLTISAIARAIKKAGDKAKEQAAERQRAEQRRMQQSQPSADALEQMSAQSHQPQHPQPRRPYQAEAPTAAPSQYQHPTPPPLPPQPTVPHRPYEAAPSPQMPQRRPPAARPQRQRVRPAPVAVEQPSASHTLAEELDSENRRLNDLEAKHEARMAEFNPAEADTEAIQARIMHVKPSQAPQAGQAAPEPQSQIAAFLSGPANARMAIILHEIFQPPLALRETGSVFDRPQ